MNSVTTVTLSFVLLVIVLVLGIVATCGGRVTGTTGATKLEDTSISVMHDDIRGVTCYYFGYGISCVKD